MQREVTDIEWYARSLEEAVRGLMHKLDERDREIVALRQKIDSLTKEESCG